MAAQCAVSKACLESIFFLTEAVAVAVVAAVVVTVAAKVVVTVVAKVVVAVAAKVVAAVVAKAKEVGQVTMGVPVMAVAMAMEMVMAEEA